MQTRRATPKRQRISLSGAVLIAPTILLLLLVFVASMETLLEYSLQQFKPNGQNIIGTTASWRTFFTSSSSWRAIRETLLVAAIVTAILAVVGYATAYALHCMRSKLGRNLGLSIVFSSLLFSGIASVYAWQLLLGHAGMVNSVLEVFGLGPYDILYQRIAVVIALVQTLMPLMVFPIINSLRQVDGALTEVADDLGASPWRTFRTVTLPLSAPGLVAGCELVFAISVSAFAAPALLGGGRVQTLSTTIYSLVGVSDFPSASVAALVLLAIALLSLGIFTVIEQRSGKADQGGVTVTPHRPRGVKGLGVWLAAVYVFQLVTVLIVIITSFSSVAYGVWPPPGFSIKWYQNLFQQDGVPEALISSLVVALAVLVLSVVIGVMASVALARHRLPQKAFLQSAILSPAVIPKIAFGFAAFMLVYRLGQTPGRFALVLTHLVACLPFVVVVVTAALARADRTVDDAAVDLGAGRVQAFMKATLPQIRPAVIVGGLFAFLVSFNELDLSLFLLSSDQKTLPVWMFNYLNNYQDPTPAALSTLMGAVSVLALLVAAPFMAKKRPRPIPALPTTEPEGVST